MAFLRGYGWLRQATNRLWRDRALSGSGCWSSLARVIIAEASLSFLGLGIPPLTASWGAMLDEGRNYVTTAW